MAETVTIKVPTQEELARIGALARTWQRTPELRWYAEYVQQPPRLQQASRCLETGEIAWEDVPTVYGPNAAS